MDRKALAAAFPATLPVLMGYLAIGMAFGFMLEAIGYNFVWAFFMSLTIYAGSGQYLGVTLLASAAVLSQVALLTFLINFRHLVYGLSMLEKFRGMGWRKLYMIFSLTDETYALLASAQVPEGINPKIIISPWPCWTICTGSPGACWAVWRAPCWASTPRGSSLP